MDMKGLMKFFSKPHRPPRADSPPGDEARGEAVEGLRLYHFASCPFCVKVRLAARRLGVQLEERNIRRDPGAREELLDGGGKTQVPCLRIEDNEVPQSGATRWLYESSDIIRYLESRFG